MEIVKKERLCSFVKGLWHKVALTMNWDKEIIVELQNQINEKREVFRKNM